MSIFHRSNSEITSKKICLNNANFSSAEIPSNKKSIGSSYTEKVQRINVNFLPNKTQFKKFVKKASILNPAKLHSYRTSRQHQNSLINSV